MTKPTDACGPTCTRCGRLIDKATQEMKRALSLKLRGEPGAPPKVCAVCLWAMLTNLVTDEESSDAASEVRGAS